MAADGKPFNSDDMCNCGHKRGMHKYHQDQCFSRCEKGCRRFQRAGEPEEPRPTAKRSTHLKTIASWRNTKKLGYSISLTASGRVLLHRPGGKQELSHFSERWLDRPQEMIEALEQTLEDGYVRVTGRH